MCGDLCCPPRRHLCFSPRCAVPDLCLAIRSSVQPLSPSPGGPVPCADSHARLFLLLHGLLSSVRELTPSASNAYVGPPAPSPLSPPLQGHRFRLLARQSHGKHTCMLPVCDTNLLRGTIVNRTYGLHKNLHICPFLLTRFGPINYAPP